SSATNALLILTDVSATNAGTYSVVVSNSFGTAASSGAILVVRTSPSNVFVQPTNLVVLVHQDASFSVTAQGWSLNYQWLSNGVPLVGQTNTVLSFENAQTDFSAIYAVVVSNFLRSMSAVCQLVVTNVAGSITSTQAVLTLTASGNARST